MIPCPILLRAGGVRVVCLVLHGQQLLDDSETAISPLLGASAALSFTPCAKVHFPILGKYWKRSRCFYCSWLIALGVARSARRSKLTMRLAFDHTLWHDAQASVGARKSFFSRKKTQRNTRLGKPRRCQPPLLGTTNYQRVHVTCPRQPLPTLATRSHPPDSAARPSPHFEHAERLRATVL